MYRLPPSLSKKIGRRVDCKTVRIFAYSSAREQSNKRSGTKLKTESETGERRFFLSLHTPHTLPACEARALRARKALTPRFTNFFTDFEKKPTVLKTRRRDVCESSTIMVFPFPRNVGDTL